MEFSVLYAIQNLHCEFLDHFVLGLTNITGSYGQLWLIVAAILLIFKKTRKCGLAILVSYALVFIIGQYGLKDLVARPRPCHLDETVELLVSRPSSYSFPSTHSAWAFAAATAVFTYHKKFGIAVAAVALLIAFSRLYLFVHFPTDVLAGIALGILAGWAGSFIINRIFAKIESIRAKKA